MSKSLLKQFSRLLVIQKMLSYQESSDELLDRCLIPGERTVRSAVDIGRLQYDPVRWQVRVRQGKRTRYTEPE